MTNRGTKRTLAWALSLALLLGLLPTAALAAGEGLSCESHPEHTAECGYVEGQPCNHSCELCAVQENGPTPGASDHSGPEQDSDPASLSDTVPQGRSGGTISGNGYSFDPGNGTLTISSNDGTKVWSGSLSIDKSAVTSIVLQDSVTKILTPGFRNCTGITSITLPPGLESIGNDAFRGCVNLETVDFSQCTKLTTIGGNAFEGCENLILSELPSTVTDILADAFGGCGKVTLNQLPSGLTSIGQWAFSSSGVTLSSLPDSVTHLGDQAFQYCTGITAMDLSDMEITSLPASLFEGCSNLETVTFPSGMTAIGASAFRDCVSLSLSELPNTVTSIGNSAFSGCGKVTLSAIPDVTTLGSGVFYRCGGITSMDLSGATGLTAIPAELFRECSNLETVTLPNSVTSIEDRAFQGCASLTLDELPSSLETIGARAFNGCGSLALTKLPDSVTSIGEFAFYKCTSLALDELPSSLETIGASAFDSCGSLALTELPGGITAISNSAFSGCGNLALTKLPDRVTSIGTYSFNNCTGLTGLELPAGLDSIGEYAFNNCTGLTTVTLPRDTAPTLGEGAFTNTPGLAIFLPFGAKGYDQGGNWPRYADKLIYGAALSGLTVNGRALDPAFFPGTDTYAVSVPYPVENVTFTPTAHGSGAITVNGTVVASGIQSAAIPLALGETKSIPIVVKNSEMDSRTYTISVTRTPLTAISIETIPGVTPPARGATPVTAITETAQYTGSVTWLPDPGAAFAAGTVYTATITLTPKDGYTLQGVTADYFTVTGATATNDANSGTIKAVFPKTGSAPSGGGSSGSSGPSFTEQTVSKVEKAKDGDTVKLDLPSGGKLPGKVLEAAAGKDITLEISAGKGVTWVINGKDIPTGKLADLNLKVDTKANTIPVTVINALTGEKTVMQLKLSHNGPFGFPLTLRLDAGKDNAGLFANLYYYNETAKELEYQTTAEIGPDGTAHIPFAHASSYAVIIDKESHAPVIWENPFTDVGENDWFYEAVAYVHQQGLMVGTTDTTFSPSVAVTRAQVWTVLARLAGQDTTGGAPWYAPAQAWAVKTGVSDGTNPDGAVTREQLVTMLYRYAQSAGMDLSVGEDTNILSYTDALDVAEWAIPAFQWSCGSGIVSGTSNTTLSPQAGATRAQLAQVLKGYMESFGG